MQSVHEGVRYDCNQCDYRATQQSNLNSHMKSIHEGIRYECNQCNNRATQTHHNFHMRLVHKEMYDCDQCGYRASSQIYLNTHVNKYHE